MPIVIKEMHVRTVVERRIVTEAELTEEMLRKIENRGSGTDGGNAPQDRKPRCGKAVRP